MIAVPAFENVAIVGDNHSLAAEVSALFTRKGRYFPVIDAPRMARSDASNEVIRRTNALAFARPKRTLFANMPQATLDAMSEGLLPRAVAAVSTFEDCESALRGYIRIPTGLLRWGQENLGIGVMLARRAGNRLALLDDSSPTISFVAGGKHLLVVCEAGNPLSEVIASNFAFATSSSLLIVPSLDRDTRDQWMDDLYDLESGGNVSSRFELIRDRARAHLPRGFAFESYREIHFITSEFPWGVCFPGVPTSHLFSYPDLGRTVVEGIWASTDVSRSARTALLVNPQAVDGLEVEAIAKALTMNGTLVRVQSGKRASMNRIETLIETVPFDIIVFSTHAGDSPGIRTTYEFIDSKGITRRLGLDEAIGFSYDSVVDKYLVRQFERFRELDRVLWSDRDAKSRIDAGTAIQSWLALDLLERQKCIVERVEIPRVVGSMGLQMNDSVWIPMMHGLSPHCAPVVLNNSCSSWHELSQRFTYAGARAYIGALFTVTEAEAQEVGSTLFGRDLAKTLSKALWSAQNFVYGTPGRRPYALVGLPFSRIGPNTVDSVGFLVHSYEDAIVQLGTKARHSPYDDVRRNCARFQAFVIQDFEQFKQKFGRRFLRPHRSGR